MSTKTSFERRPLTRDQLRAWTDLYAEILTADGDDDILSEDDLAEEFTYPLLDFDRGSIAVYDGATMVGYCVLVPRSSADPIHEMRQYGGVHSNYRGQGVGSALLDWSERAAMELHDERFGGQPVALGGSAMARNTAAATLFADHGYVQSRWFHQMTANLSAGLPALRVPDGVEIAGFTSGRSADALLIKNEAFRDHWGTVEATEESWAHYLSLRSRRPEYSFLAYLDGEPVGLVMSEESQAYNEAKGERDLYIAQVGTRRAGRRRGIASALIATALTAARADGFDTSTLNVDADSLTGALGLYERLGFAVVSTSVIHRKVLRA